MIDNFSISEIDGLNLINRNMKNILSVGISTNGNAEVEMLNRFDGVVTATTIDENGLESTRRIVEEKGLSSSIDLKLEDVRDNHIYSDEYFDYIYARLVLHYLTDSELLGVLKEFRRILKVDGLLYIVVRSDKCDEYHDGFISYDKETGMTEHKTFTGRIDKRRFHNIDSISKIINDSGFKIKSIKDYDEKLYADYERTVEVTVRNNLIEVICVK
jgi:cyclopropane fatty-acyl-phospholipid synthase-like methyltransferase